MDGLEFNWNSLLWLLIGVVVSQLFIFFRQRLYDRTKDWGKVKVEFNYDKSYWVEFQLKYFLVLHISVINKGDHPITGMKIIALPSLMRKQKVGVSYSHDHEVHATTEKDYDKLLPNEPLTVDARTRLDGTVVFQSLVGSAKVKRVIFSFLDHKKKVKVNNSRIKILDRFPAKSRNK